MTSQHSSNCQCNNCECLRAVTDVNLLQLDNEIMSDWRLRITNAIEDALKPYRLWLAASSQRDDKRPTHGFFMIFNHVLGFHVLITPHAQRGCDISFGHKDGIHSTPKYDVTELKSLVTFIQSQMRPQNLTED